MSQLWNTGLTVRSVCEQINTRTRCKYLVIGPSSTTHTGYYWIQLGQNARSGRLSDFRISGQRKQMKRFVRVTLMKHKTVKHQHTHTLYTHIIHTLYTHIRNSPLQLHMWSFTRQYRPTVKFHFGLKVFESQSHQRRHAAAGRSFFKFLSDLYLNVSSLDLNRTNEASSASSAPHLVVFCRPQSQTERRYQFERG